MKTNVFPTLLLAAALAAAATADLAAQMSGQVVNLCLNRYNSAANGDKLTVNDGEILGTIHWTGWTPANNGYHSSAKIGVHVTGTPLAGWLPSRMIFYTGGFTEIERMTILENGSVGIGLSNPAELLDINGNAIVRGTRLSLGLGSSFGDGGEALSHSDRDCAGAVLPAEVLTLNNDGGFPGGVYVEGAGGLHVCATLSSECLEAENNVVSKKGNVVALGGAALAVPCNPGDGDFIAEGANGDFITRHGHVVAEQGSVSARLNVEAQTGNVSAGQNVSAGGSVSAVQNVSAGNSISAAANVSAGQNVSAANDMSAGNNLSVGNRVSIGTNDLPAGYRLYVADGILTEKVRVAVEGSADWADYVFAPGYRLRPLAEVEDFVQRNKHLPGVPSAETVAAQGIDVAKMDALLLEKIEELTLYLLEMKKENAALRQEVEALKTTNR